MKISLLRGTSSAAGYDAPLALLSACHERISKQCATLQQLLPHLAAHGADADARTAASTVIRYFDTAGRHHHEDEECDLFPALLESMAGSDATCLLDITRQLAREHRELDVLWQALRVQLQAVLGGDAVALDAASVSDFVTHNARHIAQEEGELLPMAKRLLNDEQLHVIGEAMRRRREV